MEVPGRDVTADALGPEDPGPATDDVSREPVGSAGDTGDEREGGGVGDKLREAAEKVKDAVTPDR